VLVEVGSAWSSGASLGGAQLELVAAWAVDLCTFKPFGVGFSPAHVVGVGECRDVLLAWRYVTAAGRKASSKRLSKLFLEAPSIEKHRSTAPVLQSAAAASAGARRLDGKDDQRQRPAAVTFLYRTVWALDFGFFCLWVRGPVEHSHR